MADRSAQRKHFTKEEAASPTVSTNSLMITLTINTMETRDVASTDVVGAYLNANMPDFTLLKLTGKMVESLCQFNAKYIPFVTEENGKRRYIYSH